MQITDNGRTVTVERRGYVASCDYDCLPKVAVWRCNRALRKAERIRKRLAAVTEAPSQQRFVSQHERNRDAALAELRKQEDFVARLRSAIEAGLVRGPKK